ncbi:MAG: tRNA epoxyqueuosine(34) reductase QueG [Candidatus Thiodiazotropha endolucinida]
MRYALQPTQLALLTRKIKTWAHTLGLSAIGITDTDLTDAEAKLEAWLANGFHGDMGYMEKHGTKRSRPAELEPGTTRIISARLNYLPESLTQSERILADPERAFVARYALGRDYHKLLRKRLQKLVELIRTVVNDADCRVYVDSAPVLEKPLAQKAGLGWIGKHTNLIARNAGSWFFLGEIYTDIPLLCDAPAQDHCGDCSACIDCCPTQAIVAPYQLDARRCISYLTIELQGSIPEHFRRDMGNRIFGCDDCMQVCPWNRFAQLTREIDFLPRASLDSATLVALFNWDEATFLQRTEGSAIRRLGHTRWLRNIAVALGNASTNAGVVTALQERLEDSSPLVREHIVWALQQHRKSCPGYQ